MIINVVKDVKDVVVDKKEDDKDVIVDFMKEEFEKNKEDEDENK